MTGFASSGSPSCSDRSLIRSAWKIRHSCCKQRRVITCGRTWCGSATSTVCNGRSPASFRASECCPARIALLGADEPWIDAFCRARHATQFRGTIWISAVPHSMTRVLTPTRSVRLCADAGAERSRSRQRLREQTEMARRRGIFGAPTFFVGDDMFWGNDRLDDALAFAAERGAVPCRTRR